MMEDRSRYQFSTEMKIIALLTALLVLSCSVGYAEEKKEESGWKTHVEFSYVEASGNTDTESLAGKIEIKNEEEINRYFLKGNILYAKNNDQETSNKFLVEGRWERRFTEKIFGFLNGNYLRDKFSGYEYRVSGGPGLGYEIIKTETHQLKGLVSGLYYYDRFSKGTKNLDSYATGKAAVHYLWQILDNLKFKENTDYLISFKDGDKYFINSETAIEVKIKGNVSLGVSYVVNYQNMLPSPELKHIDTTFITSLVMDF